MEMAGCGLRPCAFLSVFYTGDMSERFRQEQPPVREESTNSVDRLIKRIEAKTETVRRHRKELEEGKSGLPVWLDAMGAALELSAFLDAKGADLDQLIDESMDSPFRSPGSARDVLAGTAVGFTRLILEYEQGKGEARLKAKERTLRELAKLQGTVEGLDAIEKTESDLQVLIDEEAGSRNPTPQAAQEAPGVQEKYQEMKNKEIAAKRQQARQIIESLFD